MDTNSGRISINNIIPPSQLTVRGSTDYTDYMQLEEMAYRNYSSPTRRASVLPEYSTSQISQSITPFSYQTATSTVGIQVRSPLEVDELVKLMNEHSMSYNHNLYPDPYDPTINTYRRTYSPSSLYPGYNDDSAFFRAYKEGLFAKKFDKGIPYFVSVEEESKLKMEIDVASYNKLREEWRKQNTLFPATPLSSAPPKAPPKPIPIQMELF